MRSVIALTLLGACSTENELRYTSTLRAETQGVVLSDDGFDAYAGMSGTTCRIDTTWGCPTSDADLPTDDERIVDHWNGQTVGISEHGVHTIIGERHVPELDVEVSSVLDAKLTHAGPFVLHGTWPYLDCAVTTDRFTFELPTSACDQDRVTTIDRDGTLYIASGRTIYRIGSLSGVDEIAADADLMAVDVANDIIVYSNFADHDIIAIDGAGRPLWIQETPDLVHGIAMRGDKDVLVLIDQLYSDYGRLERRSTATGELLGSTLVPGGRGELVVSGNGRTVGIVHPDEIHWYAYEVEGERVPIDETVESCMEAWSRATND